MFTEVSVTQSVDDVDLPCPSAAISIPAPLVSVMPVQDVDEEEASEIEADEASEAELQGNIELLSILRTPPLQRAAKRRAETVQVFGWTDLLKGFVLHHVMCRLSVWQGGTDKRRRMPEAVATPDDEGEASCALLLTISERE